MAQPIRRSITEVRAYADQLRALMTDLATDPLDEHKSVALVAHIVGNRSSAAAVYDALEAEAMGASC